MPKTALSATIGLLVIGGFVRLAYLDTPPLDFHPTRQYRSALIARAESPVALAALPESQRAVAVASGDAQVRIEPEIVEALAAASYRILGREDLRAPRAISIVAWLGGAVAAMWWARLMAVGWPFALVALGITVLAPFGIVASRTFMPDPLMTALTMTGLAVSMWHHQRPSTRRWLLRGSVLAAAIYVKPMALFFIAPPLVAVEVARLGLARGVLAAVGAQAIATLPAGVYYVSLITAGNPVAEARILPALLMRPTFWSGWSVMIGRVIGWPALIASLAGVLLSGGLPRLVLGGAWLGYLVFGLLLTHHISTHDYYSLPIVPIAATSIAVLLSVVARWSRLLARVATPVALAAVAAYLVPGFAPSRLYGDIAAMHQAAADYARIGELAGHGVVVSLDGAYGFPLSYHGLVNSRNWPLSADRAMFAFTGGSEMPATDRLASFHAGFFAATNQPELEAQPDLEQLLETRYAQVERAGERDQWRYAVYDLRTERLRASPDRLSLHTRAGGASGVAVIDVGAPDGVTWRAESGSPEVLPIDTSGHVGSGPLRITATPQSAGADQVVTVKLTSDQAVGLDISVRVRTLGAGPNAPPFGVVDVPLDPVTITGAPVVFQGWALDDVSLVRVEVLAEGRDQSTVDLGTVRLAGPRPDVAKAFPQAHDLLRSAWIFELQPERIKALPRPVTLVFRGVDGDGAVAVIGRRRIN